MRRVVSRRGVDAEKLPNVIAEVGKHCIQWGNMLIILVNEELDGGTVYGVMVGYRAPDGVIEMVSSAVENNSLIFEALWHDGKGDLDVIRRAVEDANRRGNP